MKFNSGSSNNENDMNDQPIERIEPEILNKSPQIYFKVINLIKANYFCMECLGRQFSYLATDTSNSMRAEALLLGLTMECHQLLKMNSLEKQYTFFNFKPQEIIYYIALSTRFKPAIELLNQLKNNSKEKNDIDLNFSKHACSLCHGYLKPISITSITKLIVTRVKEYEFETFAVGTFVNPIMENREEEMRAKYEIQMGESFKANLNRVYGKQLKTILNKEPELKKPDLRIMIDLRNDPNIEIHCYTLPLYIQGKYIKFSRKIPQIHWHCYQCHGTGLNKRTGETCPICKGKGDFYQNSIHELLDNVITPIFGGDGSKFHGTGREDVQTQCFGTGRHFILEIKNPKKRSLSLDRIKKEVNKKWGDLFKISDLKYSNKEDVQNIKQNFRKSIIHHQGVINLGSFLSEHDFHLRKEEIEKTFHNKEVIQRTPLRFISFRKDTTKKKTIFNLRIDFIDELHLFVDIKAEPGIYLEEFINGDEYRTTPSLAEFLGIKMKLSDHVLFL